MGICLSRCGDLETFVLAVLRLGPGAGGRKYRGYMRARSPSGHEVPERRPIRLDTGDEVTVGRRDTRWPAFVFVTSPSGEGWVPARHLSAEAGTAVLLVPYDTTELKLAPDEEVTVIERDDVSGWWWCGRADGTEGWVPVAALDPIS